MFISPDVYPRAQGTRIAVEVFGGRTFCRPRINSRGVDPEAIVTALRIHKKRIGVEIAFARVAALNDGMGNGRIEQGEVAARIPKYGIGD